MRIAVPLAILFIATACLAQKPLETAQQTLLSTPLDLVPEPEVLIPKPPTVFSADDRKFLCYELFITNMGPTSVRLERIDVYAEGSESPIYEQDRRVLKHSLNHPGWTDTELKTNDVQILRAGERVVDFVWIELPSGKPTPKSLVHTITLQLPADQKPITVPGPSAAVINQFIAIEPPLRGANWLAANGPSNSSDHRTSMDSFYGETYLSQRFAIDWVKIDQDGNTFHGDPLNLHSYFSYSQPVYAVANSTVTSVRDGLPDGIPETNTKPADPRVPITLDTIAGNHVILDLGSGVYAGYAHLQPGSIRVKAGQHVRAGDILGLVGQSGNADHPHLHFQLMDANNFLAAQGLPYAFRMFRVRLGTKVVNDDLKPFPLPQPILHKGEIPLENEIVEFP